jgi:fatty-acyl-CoA synthase
MTPIASPLTALRGHARHRPSRLAIVDGSTSWDHGALWHHVEETARAIRESGVSPGAGVMLAVDSGAGAVAAVLGTMLAGCVAMPLNTRLTAAETDEYVASVRPSLALTAHDHLDLRVGDAVGEVTIGVDRFVVAQLDGSPLATGAGDDIDRRAALVLGTGGTTGTPKGALFDHHAVWDWTMSAANNNHVEPDDVELFVAPMFHGTLVTGLLTTLVMGGAVRIMSRFDAEHAAELLNEGRATRVLGASTVVERIVDAARALDPSRSQVRFVQFGMSASRPELASEIAAAFPGAAVITGYGTTEFGPVTRAYSWEFDARGRPEGVGRPVPGTDLRIVGTDGRELPVGESGEIVAWSPWQMRGYLGIEQDEHVWGRRHIRSGDIGRFDESGCLWLTGRAKDTIRTGGETVYPSEVESALRRRPEVAACAVFGVPDPTWGERVHAAIVGREPRVDVERIATALRRDLAGFKVPKRWHVLDALPMTSNDKVDRRALRALAEGDS